MSFGTKMAEQRKKQGITQEKLAEQLGVTRQTISKWELDQSTPDINYISQLSDIFSVTTDYLIKEKFQDKDTFVQGEMESKQTISRMEKGLTHLQICGVLLAVIGGISFALGLFFGPYNGEWLLGIAIGIPIIIIGIEMIIVKKAVLLTVIWTVWIFFFISTGLNVILTGRVLSVNIFTVSGIIKIILLIGFVALIINKFRNTRKF